MSFTRMTGLWSTRYKCATVMCHEGMIMPLKDGLTGREKRKEI